MRKVMLAACICLVFFSGIPSWALPQVPPQQGKPSWTVSDGGTTTIASNITTAKTYRVSNNGPDQRVTAKVYNSANELVDSVEVTHGDDVDVGVPNGGDLKVEDTDSTDTDPSNTKGANGTYEIV